MGVCKAKVFLSKELGVKNFHLLRVEPRVSIIKLIFPL